MRIDDAFDPSGLTALVIDPNHYVRGISVEQLRAMGFKRVIAAPDIAEGWEALCAGNPDVVFIEWLDGGDGGLSLVRRIRSSEDAPNRAVKIFMLTNRGGRADVETARRAGVDAYLRKPISFLALRKRVRSVVVNPQPFVVTASYVGPCRRRRRDPLYAGPLRRLDDQIDAPAGEETDEADLNMQLARACVAALDAAARDFSPGDARKARKVFQAAQDLCDLSEQLQDSPLSLGARELVRYLQAQGATEHLDPEVVRTHIAALHQLVHLPASLHAERDSVAGGLKRMVDKKLRQRLQA